MFGLFLASCCKTAIVNITLLMYGAIRAMQICEKHRNYYGISHGCFAVINVRKLMPALPESHVSQLAVLINNDQLNSVIRSNYS